MNVNCPKWWLIPDSLLITVKWSDGQSSLGFEKLIKENLNTNCLYVPDLCYLTFIVSSEFKYVHVSITAAHNLII